LDKWEDRKKIRVMNEAKVNESKHPVESASSQGSEEYKEIGAGAESPETTEADLATKLKGALQELTNEKGHAQEALRLVEIAESSADGTAATPLETLALWVEDQRSIRDLRDRWMRSVAELDNFRKRAAQERANLMKHGLDDLLRELLPIMDNLKRALEHAKTPSEAPAVIQGVEMTLRMFQNLLEKHSVREIEAVGEKFDPKLHEAVARVPAGDQQANVIVEELEKGYMSHDRLLRPTKAVVSVPA
jgi:molecular chaperone GrpE